MFLGHCPNLCRHHDSVPWPVFLICLLSSSWIAGFTSWAPSRCVCTLLQFRRLIWHTVVWGFWGSYLAPQVRITGALLSILSWCVQQVFLLALALVWSLSRLVNKIWCLPSIFQIHTRAKVLLRWLQVSLTWDERSLMSMMTFRSQEDHRHSEVEETIKYLLVSCFPM